MALTYAEMLDETWERIGVDPSSVQDRHLLSARRSYNLLLIEMMASDWDEEDYTQQLRFQIPAGQRWYLLASDVIDALDIVALNFAGNPIPLTRMSRQDDLFLQNLATQNAATFPTNYWVSRTAEMDPNLLITSPATIPPSPLPWTQAEPAQALLLVWPTPAAAINMVMNAIRFPALMSANLAASPDAKQIWYEAIISGWAWKLSQKYAQDMTQELKAEFTEQRMRTRPETRERGPVVIGGRGFGRSRRRRA